MNKEPKFEVVNGWIRCLALFQPHEIDDDVWYNMTVAQHDEQGNWSKYRFLINEV